MSRHKPASTAPKPLPFSRSGKGTAKARREAGSQQDRATEAGMHLDAVLEIVRHPMLVVDSDLRVHNANMAFCRAFDLSRENAIGHPLHEILNGDWTAQRLRSFFERVTGGDRVDDLRLTLDFPGLGQRELLLSARPLELAPTSGCVLVAFQDISGRSVATDARYRRLFESAKNGILVAAAATGHIIDANPFLLELLGYSRSELVMRSLSDFFASDTVLAELHQLQRGPENDFIRFETRITTKSGTPVDVECTSTIYLDSGRKVIQCTIYDVTAAKRAHAQLAAALHEKEALLKEIHHRVKNNLQIVYSLLNLQAPHIHDKRDLELYKESQNRIKSMALIHEELYRSKDLSRIDFSEYVRKLAANLARSYGINPDAVKFHIDVVGITLGIDIAIPCGLMISELVSNSLKHAFPSGQRGEICIRMLSHDPEHYTITVSDNGVGLPADIELQNADTLGLQLVYTLSEQLGAEIEVSRQGGTRFQITFPTQESGERL